MARPRSDEKESAITAAAIRIFAAQGLGAATADVAREAGVSNGSLFVYFPTKSHLLNRLYTDLKAEMGAAAMAGNAMEDNLRDQFSRAWRQWLLWGTTYPDKLRALALLGVSHEVSDASRQTGHYSMAELASLIEQCRLQGALRDAPRSLVVALVSATAETTMNAMRGNPSASAAYSDIAFDAVWRMLS